MAKEVLHFSLVTPGGKDVQHYQSLLLLSHFSHLQRNGNQNHNENHFIPSVLCCAQSLSHVQLFATPWTAARQTSLSITNSRSLLKLMSITSVTPSNHLIICCPLHLLPSIFPSIRVFSNESVIHIRWPKYWSFSFIISPPNEYSGLISFRIDWFYLLVVQGTLKSLLQHHSWKASILRHSAFFMVLRSHPYMNHWKNYSFDYVHLCRQSDVSAF